MRKFFEELRIQLNEVQLEKFEKYYQLLIEYNDKFNITAITEKEEVYKKHFVDSLYDVDKLISGNYLDVGSGGGFPAIPIAIVREDINYTLLEATGKKCEFLSAVIKELNLKNVKVINGRAEEYSLKNEFREKFTGVSARAVARLNILAEYCIPFVKIGGFFVAYKGDVDSELNEARKAFSVLGGELKSVDKTELFGAKRAVVFVKKIKPTEKKYPRSNGKIRKSPL